MTFTAFVESLATTLSIMGAIMVASAMSRRRALGFGIWLVANTLWIAWAAAHGSWGFMATQIVFCLTSWHGLNNSLSDTKC